MEGSQQCSMVQRNLEGQKLKIEHSFGHLEGTVTLDCKVSGEGEWRIQRDYSLRSWMARGRAITQGDVSTIFMFCFSETGSPYVAQAGLEFMISYLQSTGITTVHHHAWFICLLCSFCYYFCLYLFPFLKFVLVCWMREV
jgi:hypothetical protein